MRIYTTLLFFCILVLNVKAQYKIGDIYDKDGVRGIVYKVSEGGKHGMIFSLSRPEKGMAKWCSQKKLYKSTQAFSETDGMYNMNAIGKFIEENNESWDSFPLFKWCRSLGEGWYIPALEEMKEIFENVIIQGSLDSKCTVERINTVNKKITAAGGDSMISMSVFENWSCSTESSNGTIPWMMYVELKKKFNLLPAAKKSYAVKGTRAVHAF